MVTTLLASTAGCDRRAALTVTPRTTACDVLTRDDVRDALGAPAAPPEAAGDAGADVLAGRSGCAWTTDDGSNAALVELVRTRDMSASVRRTGFSARARFAAARSRNPHATSRRGVGDDAMWIEETATLHVLVGDDYLTFEVAVPDPAAAERTALDLAIRALRHLGHPTPAD